MAWGISSKNYIKNAVELVESLINKDGNSMHLKTTANVPLPVNYQPKLDLPRELGNKLTS